MLACVALLAVAGVLLRNHCKYEYEWGVVDGIRHDALGWRYGRTEIRVGRAAAKWPDVLIQLGDQTLALGELREGQLLDLGFKPPRVTETDSSPYVSRWYDLGYPVGCEFRAGKIHECKIGPYWREQSGPYFLRSRGGARYRFPLREGEVEALFGEPRSKECAIRMD